ncbi:MAG: Cache 3/Cache 2 fusion domain-containing protein, partial [Cyclobacteriaceae bacterium]
IDATYSLKDFLAGLYQFLDEETTSKQAEVDHSLQLAEALLFEQGVISEDHERQMKVMATHQISGLLEKVKVPLWFIHDHQLHYDTRIVDQIQEKTQSTSTIFQKIPQGYLRISTNVLKSDGTRAVNTYIPMESPVVQAVEKGKTYRGVAFVVNDWYATAYKPISIDGKIRGMLYVGVKEPLSVIEGNYLNDYHRDIISILSRLFQENHSESHSVISELIHVLYRKENQAEGNKLLQLGLRQLIILLMQASSQSRVAKSAHDKDEQLRERLTYIGQYIRFNLSEDLNMQSLADKAHMSQSTFFRAFKSYFGMTPTDYINRERVLKAYQLLKTPEKSVADVCFEVGYNNTSYFIKQFKMYHGLTPKQFKKEIG